MEARFIDGSIFYDGSQLRSHWAFEQFGILGDSIVSFVGGARVEADRLVDWVDRRAGDYIASELMLHFIVERFDPDLLRAVLAQRLLVARAAEILNLELRKAAGRVERRGDDLFVEGKKLSVCIATVSPVSSIVHFGLNVEPGETPVSTIGLNELDVHPKNFASTLLQDYVAELESAELACKKVRWVR